MSNAGAFLHHLALVLFAFMCSSLLNLPSILVTAREAGVFRSYRINGVPASSILGIPVVSTAVHMAIIAVLISVAGGRFFGGTMPSNVPGFMAAALLSFAAFAGIGILIGVAAGTTTVTILVSQLVYIPSIVLGGIMVPASILPAGLQRLSLLLPASHSMRLFNALSPLDFRSRRTHLFAMDNAIAEKVHSFIMEHSSTAEKPRSFAPDPFWKGLRDAGTEPWLDTGDIDAAAKLWTAEFTALTTNNTLLNKEVQKGIYDTVIREAGPLLRGAGEAEKVIEIAFILNAMHGLRLARTFGARVSVELHTATAHDSDAAAAYGRRFHRVSPERFIVKVPLTAAGFVATRTLRREGIPVNFTLGFSARQNFLVTAFAGPSYVNVFLGRLNSYITENSLGDGLMVGEKATLASQAAVTELSRTTGSGTRQIAASMRGASQVRDLAGVDVMTIPVATAAEARSSLDGKWSSRLKESYTVKLAAGVDERKVRVSTLWEVSRSERALANSISSQPPSTADELARRSVELGVRDMFPRLDPSDSERIAADGKIPKHERWAERIASGNLAIDTLLTLAGLASFTADQAALDDRIRRLIA